MQGIKNTSNDTFGRLMGNGLIMRFLSINVIIRGIKSSGLTFGMI